MTTQLAVVGLGKIARDQHLPAIAADPAFDLVATVDPGADGVPGCAHFATLDALLESGPAVDAVAVCTPPQMRHPLAVRALAAGKHVLIEKPPCATLSEAEHLMALSQEHGGTLFAAWHSRYAAAVAPAREWLADKRIDAVEIVWREDVRVWHPGQDWIFEAGGFGVFDPAINAISIATAILPRPLLVQSAQLDIPANRVAPIAGRASLTDSSGTPVSLEMDFLQQGEQTWDIRIATSAGELLLRKGGSMMVTPAGETSAGDREYGGIYAHFARSVAAGQTVCDLTPLRIVADCFLRAEMRTVAQFVE